MIIKKIISQNGFKFEAIMLCEGCGEESEHKGYDNYHYRVEVVPNLKCPHCNRSSADIRESKLQHGLQRTA